MISLLLLIALTFGLQMQVYGQQDNGSNETNSIIDLDADKLMFAFEEDDQN